MVYKFASNPVVVWENKVVFVGDNAQGVWENGVLTVHNAETKYIYENGEWFIETEFTEEPLPCGLGAVPTLNIENLQIVAQSYFENILYVGKE